jgi:hypothetical protein
MKTLRYHAGIVFRLHYKSFIDPELNDDLDHASEYTGSGGLANTGQLSRT